VKHQDQEIINLLKEVSEKKFRNKFDKTVTKFEETIDQTSSQVIWLFVRLNSNYQECYDNIVKKSKFKMTDAAWKAVCLFFQIHWSLSKPVDYNLIEFPDDTHFENIHVRQLDIRKILSDSKYRKQIQLGLDTVSYFSGDLLPPYLLLIHPTGDKKIILERIDNILTERDKPFVFDIEDDGGENKMEVKIENLNYFVNPRFQTSEPKNTITVAVTYYLRMVLNKKPAETATMLKSVFHILGVSDFGQIRRNVLHFRKVANASPWIFFNTIPSSKPSGRSKPWPSTPEESARFKLVKKKMKKF
jgi:hypothetical protein